MLFLKKLKIKSFKTLIQLEKRQYGLQIKQQVHQIQILINLLGSNKNIVNKPIILTIYSSTCPDLTLVDLPGITRIPLHGSG